MQNIADIKAKHQVHVLQMSSKLNPKAVIFQKITIQIWTHVSGAINRNTTGRSDLL